MMKKTLAVMVFALASGAAVAADNTPTQLQSGVYVENTNAGCSILRDRVTVNTSTGVTMMYNCMTARNKVNLAGCHASGSQKPTNVACVSVGEDNEQNPIYNGDNCTAEGVAQVPPMQTEIQGRRAYVASTTGGSVGTASLDATECTTAALSALPALTQ